LYCYKALLVFNLYLVILIPLTLTSKPFHTLGIGVAFSPNLQANLAEATRLALKLNTALVIIHVGTASEDKRSTIKEALPEKIKLPAPWKLVFVEGNPVKAILNTINKEQIDLMVLGALRQESFIKFYLGSIARKITRQATCSVLLLVNPSLTESYYHHIVVNGLKQAQTEKTIKTAFYIGQGVGAHRITIVEEIAENQIVIKVDDNKSLRKANLLKEKLERQEEHRVKELISHVDKGLKKGIKISTQPIFGRRGYSIGHYAQVSRADLLIMNAPERTTLLDRIFPHDMEYILNELPTDVLIVR
jgi:nucleotide-binding universal stress UspA family protein